MCTFTASFVRRGQSTDVMLELGIRTFSAGPCLLVALLSACNSTWVEPVEPPRRHVLEFDEGQYFGPVYLEVHAFSGPVRLKQGECDTFVEVLVNRGDARAVTGRVHCDFGALGESWVDLAGDVDEEASVFGEVSTDLFDAEWEGFFHARGKLFGELQGIGFFKNTRIEYYGWLDVAVQPTISKEEGTELPEAQEVPL